MGNGCGSVGRSSLVDGAQRCGKLGVERDEEGNDFLCVVGLPELQVGAALQELTHTLGLLHTGHLHHDTTLLAFEGLDVGLYHAEAVDTGAEHVVGVVDGTLHLGAEHALHLLVGALRGHLVAELLCGKELGKSLVGLQLLVVLNK